MQLGMVLLYILPLWHHLQGWFHPPKMHEAEQANLNLGCLDQLEALIVTKNQLQKTKQDAKKRTWEDPSTPVRREPFASCKCSLESWYLANWNVEKVLLHRRFWMGKVKKSNKILTQILSLSQRKLRCNSTFSRQWLSLQLLLHFLFPTQCHLSLVLQTLGADVWKVPMLFLSHDWWFVAPCHWEQP